MTMFQTMTMIHTMTSIMTMTDIMTMPKTIIKTLIRTLMIPQKGIQNCDVLLVAPMSHCTGILLFHEQCSFRCQELHDNLQLSSLLRVQSENR